MSAADDSGLENAAILLMSLGEAEAAEVFKHLSPKEVQRLGETIAGMKTVTRERVDGVLESFCTTAAAQHMLVADNDEYVKAVLRRALGDEKANLLLDRILQGSDVSGLESLKWMDPQSVAELLRNEHPQIVAAILVHLDFDQASSVLKMCTERHRNGHQRNKHHRNKHHRNGNRRNGRRRNGHRLRRRLGHRLNRRRGSGRGSDGRRGSGCRVTLRATG
jgi:flagellar motor switch protein FliG